MTRQRFTAEQIEEAQKQGYVYTNHDSAFKVGDKVKRKDGSGFLTNHGTVVACLMAPEWYFDGYKLVSERYIATDCCQSFYGYRLVSAPREEVKGAPYLPLLVVEIDFRLGFGLERREETLGSIALLDAPRYLRVFENSMEKVAEEAQ